MQLGLPKSYPSACALPFNRQSLEKHFELSTPDQDSSEEGVWLLLHKNRILTVEGDTGSELPTGAIDQKLAISNPLYIGKWQGQPCRMLVVNDLYTSELTVDAHSLQARNPQLPISLLSLAGVGQMIQHWENSSRYCGYCGHELKRLSGEWGKSCNDCGQSHYPRIHPCVIGLIVKGDEILLVRKPEWADGRFGLVAGFVEFGESLEEAMAREVAEETGIQIAKLRYIGSQSWPFPSQIMNGFVADYASGEIKLQQDELAEAGWYKLNDLPILPPRRSIARYLIDQAATYLR